MVLPDMTTAHHGRADYRFVFSVPHLLFLSYYSAQSKHAKALILWNTYPVLIQWSPLVPVLGKCCQLLLLSLMVKVIPDSYIVRCARFMSY